LDRAGYGIDIDLATRRHAERRCCHASCRIDDVDQRGRRRGAHTEATADADDPGVAGVVDGSSEGSGKNFVLQCSRRLGKVRLIACIEEPDVAKDILEHLGLRAEPLPTLRARAPPVTLERRSDPPIRMNCSRWATAAFMASADCSTSAL